MNKDLAETQNRLLARDKAGNLTGTEEDRTRFAELSEKNIIVLNELVGKFTGQKDNRNFAVPGGLSVGEVQDNLKDQRARVLTAFNAEKQAQRQQQQFRNSLQQFANENATAINNNIGALTPNTQATSNNTESINNLINRLNAMQVAPPANNIPAAPPGFHEGGLIKGPRGFDNLLIRAEEGEFMMRREATAKWLPQLIQMNRGAVPRMPGNYHEGGFVQTNVGDVNITMTAPTSPVKAVREMGRAMRREIRMGNLDLQKKD